MVEGKVKGSVFKEESEVFVRDTRVLRKVGAVARGAADPSGINFTIRCLFPQLPGDSEMHPKSYVG